MSERKAEKFASAPWRIPVVVETIAEDGQHFVLAADAGVRAGIARMAGLRDLPRLEANFEVTRHGASGLRVLGRVSATVGQNCVVSLEPLTNEVEEQVDLVFLPKPVVDVAVEGEADEEAATSRWDDPEVLIDGIVDLGAIATEFLILGLDPYPRKPGAVFEPPQRAAADGGPFAALAGWSKGRGDG